MNAVFSCHPKVLGSISPEDLLNLQVAACMALLWQVEQVEDWLPASFTISLKNKRTAVNYLLTNARIIRTLNSIKEVSKQVKVTFNPGDLDSCEQCLMLNEKVFNIKEFPELPFEGCTSDTGCKCHILPYSEFEWEGGEDVEWNEPTEINDDVIEMHKPIAKVGENGWNDVIDYDIFGSGDDNIARHGTVLMFGDGSRFEYYCQYPFMGEDYELNNAAMCFAEQVEELSKKLKWHLKDDREQKVSKFDGQPDDIERLLSDLGGEIVDL
jgi:hypothetical protein